MTVDREKREQDLIWFQALAAERERRRRNDRLKYYNTGDIIHHKQIAFHQCIKRNRWLLGGNRTGKSEGGAAEGAYWARGNHPYRVIMRPTHGLVVSLTNEVQRDVAQQKILSFINPDWIKDVVMRDGRKDDPASGIIDFIKVESVHGGVSTISFKSCEQGRDKFQGTSYDWIWFDEEPPEEIYQECRMRIIDTRGSMWGTMTPLKGLTWVYELIYCNSADDPEVWTQTMEWADNPFLSPDEIAQLESTMTEEEREARQYGRFVALSGLVYPEFREDIHVIDPKVHFPDGVPKEWYDNISIDPGADHPTSVHWYACDGDGNVYVIAEHYRSGKDVEFHAQRMREMCIGLDWPITKDGWINALIDSAATQRTLAAEKNVVELFAEQKVSVNIKVRKDVWGGIQRVKLYLKPREHPDKEAWPHGKPKLFIFNTCTNMIREFKQYRWKPGTDDPIKLNDDAMDELRYYLQSHPDPYIAPAPKKSRVEEHKDRLARQLQRRNMAYRRVY